VQGRCGAAHGLKDGAPMSGSPGLRSPVGGLASFCPSVHDHDVAIMSRFHVPRRAGEEAARLLAVGPSGSWTWCGGFETQRARDRWQNERRRKRATKPRPVCRGDHRSGPLGDLFRAGARQVMRRSSVRVLLRRTRVSFDADA